MEILRNISQCRHLIPITLRKTQKQSSTFIIFTSGRTGSSLISSVLNSNNGFIVYPELSPQKSRIYQRLFFYNLIKKKYPRHTSFGGLKTKLKHIKDEGALIEAINKQKPTIIFNRRKNFLQQAVSKQRMLLLLEQQKRSNKDIIHSPREINDIVAPNDLDPNETISFCEEFERRDENIESFKKKLTTPSFDIFYEDFKSNPQYISEKLSQIFGLHITIPSNGLTVKNTSENLSNHISNYKEWKAMVIKSKYSKFLMEDN